MIRYINKHTAISTCQKIGILAYSHMPKSSINKQQPVHSPYIPPKQHVHSAQQRLNSKLYTQYKGALSQHGSFTCSFVHLFICSLVNRFWVRSFGFRVKYQNLEAGSQMLKFILNNSKLYIKYIFYICILNQTLWQISLFPMKS